MIMVIKRVGEWIKKYWKLMVGVLGSALAVLMYLALRDREEDLPSLPNPVEDKVAKTKEDIAFLEGRKATLEAQGDDHEAEIQDIAYRLSVLDGDLEKYEEDLKKMSTDEKLDEFEKFGI